LTLSDLQKNSANRYVFEEMITPPNQILKSSTKNTKAIDISNISIKAKVFSNSVDEMVNPEKLT
jgi:hypothetical protein